MPRNKRQFTTVVALKAPSKPKSAERIAEVAAKREVKRLQQGNKRVPKSASALSSCTTRYLHALADPFSELAVGVCIPVTPSFPSQKCSVFVRGVGKTGTNNLGWVLVAPFTAMANDAVCTWFTDDVTGGAYAGTTFTTAVTAGVDTTSGKSNSPYTAAQIASTTASAKMVACGIRVMYTGSELNMGGTAIGIEEPTHQSLSGLTYANVRTYRDVTEFPLTRKHIGVTYTPITAAEVQYTTYAARVQTGFFGIMIKTAVAEQPFAFELIAHFEFVGTLTAYSATPNQVDPIGFAAAQQVVQSVDSSTGVIADDGVLARTGNMFVQMANEVLGGFSAVGMQAARAAGGAVAYAAANTLGARVRGVRIGADHYNRLLENGTPYQ